MKRFAMIVWVVAFSGAYAQHEGHAMPPPSATSHPAEGPTMPEGYAEVQINPERQQLIGIKTAPAEQGVLNGTVRAAAVISADETREAHVHSKLMGWIEKLYVNAVGQRVKKGDPLYALYSQDLYAAQQEYLRARGTIPDLARAARTRLKLWDVPEDQIRRVETEGAQKSLVFRSPIDGTVIEKDVLQGHAVEPEMMLYRIADLSEVWVIAEVYEYEVARIDKAGTARVTVQGLRDPLTARVDYVYPTVDEVTRTIKVRLRVPNPSGDLRPGAFATVELPTQPVQATWVPDSAVIDTGVRKVIYVALGDGRFRPTEVRIGRRVTDKVEILAGLKPGAQVVIGAQFLLDSESRLRGVGGGGATQHGGH